MPSARPLMFPALFDAQAERTPGNIAVSDGDVQLTYEQLNYRASQLSNYLRRNGVGPEKTVGVCLRRDARLVASLLGVLKAGGTYLPLDPDYPRERLRYMAANSGAMAVITENGTRNHISGCSVLRVDLDDLDLSDEAARFEGGPLGPNDLAYCIYTSGTTGKPKGVLVEHASLANYLTVAAGPTQLTGTDRVPQLVSPSFDPSIREMCAPLLSGGCIVMLPERQQRMPESLSALFSSGQVSAVLAIVPSLLAEVLAVGEGNGKWRLRFVATAGEPLTADLAARLQARLGEGQVINQYGPTECTMTSTRWIYDQKRDGAMPIGKPIENVWIVLLDAAGNVVPQGAVGEIHIGGAGVARGYVGDPDLTSSHYVQVRLRDEMLRFYRTGDLARELHDGNLVFAGRRDSQIKVRGVRVEPGEVEARLRQVSGIRNAAVVPRVSRRTTRLVAYLTVAEGGAPAAREIRRRLREYLPAEMIPAEYIQVAEFPLTTSGKIDRGALAETAGARISLTATAAGDLPRTDTERRLAELWSRLLPGACSPGMNDSLLDLGGDSLVAAQIASTVRADYGVDVGSGEVLGAATIRNIAALIRTAPPTRGSLSSEDLPDIVPTSAAQQRLWLIDQLGAPPGLYHVSACYWLRDALDLPAFDRALRGVVARHGVLRSVFMSKDGEPYQVIRPPSEAPVQTRVERSCRRNAKADILRLIQAKFDLANDLPIRTYLLTLDDDDEILLIVLHHIAVDGWSKNALVRELFDSYRSIRCGDEVNAEPTALQYADYAMWELRSGAAESSIADRDFWMKELAGLPATLNLPADRARPRLRTYAGGRVAADVPSSLRRALGQLGRRHSATLFMVLQAALAALLMRMGAGDDIPVGSAAANRRYREFNETIGFFANMIILRTDVSGNPRFTELLERVRRVNTAAYSHQHYPFERAVSDLNPDRTLSANPLFQVVLTVEEEPEIPAALHELGAQLVAVWPKLSKFDLLFEFISEPRALLTGASGAVLTAEFSSDIFDEATAQNIVDSFVVLLHDVANNPERRIKDLDLLSGQDIKIIQSGTCGKTVPVPDTAIPEMIRRHAVANSEALAVVAEDGSLTYGELDHRSNNLARLLHQAGVGPERIVAVALPRSRDLPVAFLALLKSGGCYLPIDLSYPAERISFMLGDARPMSVITNSAALKALPDMVRHRPVILDDPVTHRELGRIQRGARAYELPAGISPLTAAYAIYTSGTTGRPKAVVMSVQALQNLIAWQSGEASDPSSQRMGQFSALGFDVSIQEILVTLVTGRCLVLPGDDTRRDFNRLIGWIADHQVNELLAPLSALEAIAETALDHGDRLSSVTTIWQGGEAFRPSTLYRRLFGGRTAYNFYGPTETHAATSYVLPRDADEWPQNVPVGHAIWNVRLYILDGDLRQVPVGVVGELHIGGAQVARGYLNQPGLTADRFMPDPFANDGTRMYRTGDLVRWRRDGEIDFVGRADDQVKLRGFRIELGEIEATLSRHAGVGRTAAVCTDSQILAFVVPLAGETLNERSLREHVARELPGHMMPSVISVVDSIPLSPSGKVDRPELLSHTAEPAVAQLEPGGSAEVAVCEVMCEVLGLAEVHPSDNFFAIGGHSLAAARLLSRIRAITGEQLSIRDIFEYPTAAGLATRLGVVRHDISDSEYATLLPLSRRARSDALFCFHPAAGLSWMYAGLLKYLDDDRPVFGLQSPALTDGPLLSGISEAASYYATQILATQSRGRYHLLGWSYGGLVAHAVAVRLQELGASVGMVGLLDSYPEEAPSGGWQPPDREQTFALILESLGMAPSPGGGTGLADLIARLRSPDSPLARLPSEKLPRVVRVFAAHIGQMRGYVPPMYRGDLILWRAAPSGPAPASRAYYWRRYVRGDVKEIAVPFLHGRMTRPEAWEVIGPQVNSWLARSERTPVPEG
jgi:amino acid adenylation domain-containing protein